MRHVQGMTSGWKRLRQVAAITALLLAGTLPALATQTETAEAFVARSGKVLQEKGAGAIADFIHPEELQRFKSMMTPILESTDPKAADPLARALFGGDATAESALRMAPVEFMRSLLKSVLSRSGMTVDIGPMQVLGSVREGDVVHVVTRGSAGVGVIKLSQVEVVSVRPYGDSWGMMLTGEMEGMAEAMRAASVKRAQKPATPAAAESPKP